MSTRPALALIGALAFVALAEIDASVARADTILIKGGGRVYGEIVERFKDAHDQRWVRVKAAFGTIEIPQRLLGKQLKSKGSRKVVRLEEAIVSGLTGTVERSSDQGETWQPLRYVVPEGETSEDAHFPVRLRPGDRVRTAKESRADLDVGYGLIRLAPESEVELLAAGNASMSVLNGRAGVRIDEKTEDREFRVETPQASMGVRGTAFVVDVTDASTRVAVGEGVVRIGKLDAKAGAVMSVAPGGEPVVDTSGITSDDEDFLAALRDGSLFPRIDWVVVPGGTLAMGENKVALNTHYSTLPIVDVTLPTFLISKTEITVKQYDAFRKWVGVYGEATLRPKGSRPDDALAPASKKRNDPPIDPREPALVAWMPAVAFARFAGGRLVSEAEWEWTAFQGSKAMYPWGDDPEEIFDHAWVGVNSGDRVAGGAEPSKELSIKMEQGEDIFALMKAARCRPRPVAGKLPSSSGVYDLIGNAAEWCADLGEDGLDGVPRDGTPRRTGHAVNRVTRGWDFEHPTAWHGRNRRTGNALTGRAGIRVVVRFDR